MYGNCFLIKLGKNFVFEIDLKGLGGEKDLEY